MSDKKQKYVVVTDGLCMKAGAEYTKIGTVIELTDQQAKGFAGKVRPQSEVFADAKVSDENAALRKENAELKAELAKLKGGK